MVIHKEEEMLQENVDRSPKTWWFFSWMKKRGGYEGGSETARATESNEEEETRPCFNYPTWANWEPRRAEEGWLLSVRLVCPLNLHDDHNVIERDVFSQLWTKKAGISHPRSVLPPLYFSLRSSHRFSGLHQTGHPNSIFTSTPFSFFFY